LLLRLVLKIRKYFIKTIQYVASAGSGQQRQQAAKVLLTA
jgi:hypothetical protein